MEILRYDPTMCRQLVCIFNQALRPVPHCYPVSADELASALAPAAGEAEGHRRLHSEAVFASRQGPSIAGFIHVAMEREQEQNQPAVLPVHEPAPPNQNAQADKDPRDACDQEIGDHPQGREAGMPDCIWLARWVNGVDHQTRWPAISLKNLKISMLDAQQSGIDSERRGPP